MIKYEFDLDLYPFKIIKIALSNYREYGRIQYSIRENKAIVVFSDCKYGDILTAKEFANYLIDLIGTENGN